MGCSIVVRQIIEVSIKNGFRTQEDWDSHFAMKGAIEKGSIGEWALQSVKDGMGGGDTENNPAASGRLRQRHGTADTADGQERKRYRSGHLRIISSAETRRQSCNASAVSFP